MDALLPAFVATLLAEFGDKTQLLAMLLAIRFHRVAPVLAGIAVAAAANSLIAALGGAVVGELIPFRALTLLTALALIFAGIGALWRQKPPTLSGYGPIGIFATSALGVFILEFGDKTQFITFALAARADSAWLTAAGATAGIVVAAAPAVLLADRFEAIVPLRAVRAVAGMLMLLTGAIVAIYALRLV